MSSIKVRHVRRSFGILTLLFLLLGMTLGSMDAQSAGPRVNLVIDGEPVYPRVPARLVGSRTMVPVRIIAESLGAQVTWHGATRQVEIVRDGMTLMLTIDKREVSVGGGQATLDVAPFIEDGTTLVPLRFVSEMLGATVGWDQSSFTASIDSPSLPGPEEVHHLTDVRFDEMQGASILVLETEGRPLFTVIPLEKGDSQYPRLLIRFSGTKSALERSGFSLGGILLRGIAFEVTNSVATEVVVDMVESTTYQVLPTEWDPVTGKQFVRIRFQDRVRDVRYVEGEHGAWVDVVTTGGSAYSAFQLDNPHRLVVDLPGLVPGDGVHGLSRTVGSNGVVSLRAALFESHPPVTRVVLDGDKPVNYDVERVDQGFRIHLHGNLQKISTVSDGTQAVLSVSTSVPVKPDVRYEGGELVIDLPRVLRGSAIPNWDLKAPLSSARVEEVPMTVDSGQHVVGTRITLGLTQYGEHGVSSKPGELRITVSGKPLGGRVVVIDPGHGGNDPGAIGPLGTTEKEVNLIVAYLLRDMLQQDGVTVHMTRYGDQNPGLYQRVALANDLKADLLISVHHNGHFQSSTRGTETYYCDNHPSSRALGQLVHRGLIKDLGLPDRYLRYKREFVLLREAQMPSVLVEAAYLTNPTEEKLLRDPAFLERIARSLYDSITEFLSP